MAASTCVVRTADVAIFALSMICPVTSAWCSWTWPAVLRVGGRHCVSTVDPARCEGPVRFRTPAGLTLTAPTVGPVPSSVGPIWK